MKVLYQFHLPVSLIIDYIWSHQVTWTHLLQMKIGAQLQLYFKAFDGSSGFNGELDMSMVGLRLKFMNEFHHIVAK